VVLNKQVDPLAIGNFAFPDGFEIPD